MKNNEFINKVKLTGNPFFIKDILVMYLKKELFFNKKLKNVNFLGIKEEPKENINAIIDIISKDDDIFIDNNSKDIYYKTRSIGCSYCTMGKGVTIVLSYKCHRDCFFCYEETPLKPKIHIDPYAKNDMDNIYKIIDTGFSNTSNKTFAITGGEPFLFTDKVYEVLEYVNNKYPDKHTRIYTTGDIMNEDKLIKLKKLKLNEIRYSIKPGEKPKLEIYALTKKYIPTVIIEMPVFPKTKKYMIDILTEINEDGNIDGINLNELTFNNLNYEKYKEKGYKLDLPINKFDIYHRYYDVPKIEIGVYGSKILCLELINYFSKTDSNFFMHYCDLDTVSTHHYLYKKAHAESIKRDYSKITNYGLHKILRIYSKLDKVLDILVKNNLDNYFNNGNFIETNVSYLDLFENKGFIIIIVYKNFDYKYDIDFKIINM
ncbi:MAG: 4Fe-4S cluster-binding domain-containing protein [Candidatus Gracilibacteria bacterium]